MSPAHKRVMHQLGAFEQLLEQMRDVLLIMRAELESSTGVAGGISPLSGPSNGDSEMKVAHNADKYPTGLRMPRPYDSSDEDGGEACIMNSFVPG